MAPAEELKAEAPSAAHYELVVLGSGPGGQRAAVQAAKLRKRVLVIERDKLGGSCIHTGTIPSKTLREAALSPNCNDINPLKSVMEKKDSVIGAETRVIGAQLKRNNVEFIQGTGRFVGPKEIEITNAAGTHKVKADFIIIATGTRPVRPKTIDFSSECIFDSDSILNVGHMPKSLAVVGAGVIGCEYASIFAKLGVKVALIDQRPSLLRSVDDEIVEALRRHFLDTAGMELYLGVKVGAIEPVGNTKPRKVSVELDGNKKLFDTVLYALGRSGNVESLNLDAAGLAANDKGILETNRFYQTKVPNIYAVGDVIGFPALAASSSEQGRLAAAHAFGIEGGQFPETFPYGIYTIPEISSVGAQEAELQQKGIPYVVGRARYKELARGEIIGDTHGFLKILVHKRSEKILGCHVIGAGATELVHIGQAAMALGAGIQFFVSNVFNYPTLAEAYKVAAYAAFNQLKDIDRKLVDVG